MTNKERGALFEKRNVLDKHLEQSLVSNQKTVRYNLKKCNDIVRKFKNG